MACTRRVPRGRLVLPVLTVVAFALGGCSASGDADDTTAIDTVRARDAAGETTGVEAARDSVAAPARDSRATRRAPAPETEGQRRTDGSPRNPPIHRTTPRDDDVLNPRAGGGAGPQGDLMAQVQALARTSGCATASDCRALPVGRKACGGPRAYVVYCPASTDESALRAKIGELDRADMEANRGAVSDCMLVTEPGITVSGGQCRAGGAPR